MSDGNDDLQTRHVIEERFDRHRVRERAAHAAAVRRADHERTRVVAVAAIADLRRLTDDLVERRIDEVGKLDLGDRPHALHRESDRNADDAGFGQRRVEHALGPEFFLQAFGQQEHIAARADVFAHQQRAFVGGQRVAQRRAHGFRVVHHRHGSCVPS